MFGLTLSVVEAKTLDFGSQCSRAGIWEFPEKGAPRDRSRLSGDSGGPYVFGNI